MTNINLYIHRGSQTWDFSAFACDADISAHLSALTRALGDDAKFRAAFEALKGDSSLKGADYIKLAREFGGRNPSSKSDALSKILDRHESLLGAVRRAARTGERTAG